MAETVRVRCAVGRRGDGKLVVLWDSMIPDHELRYDIESWEGVEFVQWITVEIPLPVEPVVVAEVECGE